MALARAQVIDAVAALLVPVVVAAGRVFTGRGWPLPVDQLPCWRVVGGSESVTQATVHGMEQHELQIRVLGYHSVVTDLDDALHALAAAGLTALMAGTPPHNLQLGGIDAQLTTENGAEVGLVTLALTATFFVFSNAPETIL